METEAGIAWEAEHQRISASLSSALALEQSWATYLAKAKQALDSCSKQVEALNAELDAHAKLNPEAEDA